MMGPGNKPTESPVELISLVMISVMVIALFMMSARHEYEVSSPRVLKHRTESSVVESPSAIQQKASVVKDERMLELENRFEQAVVMLHAKEYEHAITALHRVIELSPRMPEAYVNMGYALLGLERYQAARDFFITAADIQPYQGNAYWGLAVSQEKLGDLEAALGAMRTFIHLTPPESPFLKKARSALWEWEETLARGPLPKEEAEWLEKRGNEWDERNSPARDSVELSGDDILVEPVQ
ncbi:MAG: tetratricopeptide repeat protein [Gammaproteobacteria bacterium]